MSTQGSYYKFGVLIQGFDTITTASGTTTLTTSSNITQVCQGTQSQTVRMPDATLVALNRYFNIINNSTGTITVQDNAGGALATLAAGAGGTFQLITAGSAAGTWDVSLATSGSSSGSSVTARDKLDFLQGIAGINYNDGTTVAKVLKLNPQELGANFWLSRTALSSSGLGYVMGGSLNGYGYVMGGGDAGGTMYATTTRYSDDNNYWLAVNSLPTASENGATFTLNNCLYYAAGLNSSAVAQARNYQYNDSTGAWTSKTVNPSPAVWSCGGGIAGGYGWIVGGTTGSIVSTVDIYSDTSDTWYARASLPQALQHLCHNTFASPVLDAFYVAGGLNGGGAVTTNYRINPASNAWLTTTALTTGTDFSQSSLQNGLGYVFGGQGSPSLTNAQQFHEDSLSWSAKAPMTTGAFGGAIATINGRSVVAGGYPTSASNTPHSVVQTYVNTNYQYLGTLRRSVSTPTAIYAATSLTGLATTLPVQVRTDGDHWKNITANADSTLKPNEAYSTKFKPTTLPYIAGGSANNATASSVMQRYDDQANTWTNRQGLTTARWMHTGFTIGANAYMFSGENSSSAFITAAGEKYDDLLDAWTSATNVGTARIGAGGFSIDNYGYMVGGSTATANFTSSVTNNDRYDPSANTWTSKTALPLSRAASSVNSHNTRGFVASGLQSGGLTSTNYRYNASTDAWTSFTIESTDRRESIGAELNSFALIAGGFNGSSYVTSVDSYNESTNSWTLTTGALYNHQYGSAFTYGGFLYHAGSSGGVVTAERYNDAAKSFSAIASMNSGSSYGGQCGSSGAYRRYEIRVGIPAYVTGIGAGVFISKASRANGGNGGSQTYINGKSVFANSGACEFHDPATDTWYTAANRNTALSTGTGFNLYGSYYTVDGGNSGTAFNTVQRLDDYLGTWTTMTGTNQAAMRMSEGNGGALNGYGYIVGGTDSSGGTVYPTSQQYNKDTNSWTNKAGLNNVRGYYFSGGSLGGFYYAIAGANGTPTFFAVNDQYNDVANVYTAKSATPIAFYGCPSVVINDRLLTGGNTSGGGSTTSYEYLHSSDTWRVGPNFTTTAMNGACSDSTGLISNNDTTSQQYIPSQNKILAGVALRVEE